MVIYVNILGKLLNLLFIKLNNFYESDDFNCNHTEISLKGVAPFLKSNRLMNILTPNWLI